MNDSDMWKVCAFQQTYFVRFREWKHIYAKQKTQKLAHNKNRNHFIFNQFDINVLIPFTHFFSYSIYLVHVTLFSDSKKKTHFIYVDFWLDNEKTERQGKKNKQNLVMVAHGNRYDISVCVTFPTRNSICAVEGDEIIRSSNFVFFEQT